jgi:hypothetical protein
MTTPSEAVAGAFNQANSYAADARTQVAAFTNAMIANLIVPTVPSVEWTAIEPPTPAVPPTPPDALSGVEADMTFDAGGGIAGTKPADLVLAAPTVTIDDFTEVAPEVDVGTAPTLTFPAAPTVTIGAAPTVPDIAEITVPAAPVIVLPAAPTYLTLSTPTFAGVDLHADFLTPLETQPALSLVAPTPYTYTPGPEYSSSLLTALKATLTTRLAGGTGLDPTVEQAIFDRARDREAIQAQANITEATRLAEAAGFPLPTGALAADIRRAQREYYDKVSGASREIMVKQADLEQGNLEKTIATVMDLEGKLVENAFKLEQLAYESAKTVATNAVEIYNAQVTKFRAVVDAYNAYAGAYKTIIDGELAKVEVYKAEIQGELAKAQTNQVLVQQYEADIRAKLANVELYRVQIDAAKVLMELEGAKLGAIRERIQAYVAGINGETAKVEAYKATVQAEAVKAEAYRSGVQGQLAVVDVFKAKADAFQAQAGAQGEKARAELGFYEARVRAYTATWDGWRARVAAEAERVKAIGMKSEAVVGAFRAELEGYKSTADVQARLFEAQVSQYSAQRNYTLAAEKMNADIVHSNNSTMLEASKVGAQTYAQLAAAAYNTIKAQASVSGDAKMSVSYDYKGEVNAAVSPQIAI